MGRPREVGAASSTEAQLLSQISKQIERLIQVTAANNTTTTTTTTP